ncbi:hypothetical protein AB0C07_11840 [Actinoplanes missouriensis]|uniref:hypothetical protein n=1 Tax=Actinoplanes missouriensis TaxID=1866 RepID=UPI0033E564AA
MTILLPAVDQPAVAGSAAALDAGVTSPAQGTILMVEDEDALRLTTGRWWRSRSPAGSCSAGSAACWSEGR